MRPPVALLLLAAVVAAIPSRPANGCAVALKADTPGSSVEIAAETALIVWDEKTKTEHFIRTASFASTSADFGFLIPTPTQPTIEEVDPAIFRTLTSTTAPRTETIVQTVRPELSFGCHKVESFSATAGNMTPKSVEVLEKKKIGDYDVAVLKADDAGKLREWLEKNGYDARPQLTEWLKFYTDHKWILTAFKISADRAPKVAAPPSTGKSTPKTASSTYTTPNANPIPFRLSFQTERPFYPYREPADQRLVSPDMAPPLRLLRVFFVSDARFSGTLGDKGEWPGKTVWANKLDPTTFDTVAKGSKLPEDLNGRPWFLTEYEDSSSPRPGTDEVYFTKAVDQATVERPPVTVYEYRESPTPGTVLGILAAIPVVLLIAGLLVRRMVKKRGAGGLA